MGGFNFLDARRAVVTWNGDFASFRVKSVDTIIVVFAASNAEAVLCWFDLLNVESALVIAGENTERLRGNTVISLSR